MTMTRDEKIGTIAFVFCLVVLFLAGLAPLAHCQELYNAPSADRCWRGTYNDAGELITEPMPCEQLPTRWHLAGTPALRVIGYWSFRHADEPYLRTNRETLHSKGFWVPVAGAILATTADVVRNRHNPAAPQGRELLVDAYVPLAVCLPLDYVADRFFGRPIGTGVMSYFIGRHTYGAVTRRYP